MYTVSEHAWRTGGAPSGSTAMFAAIHSSIPIHDLLRGLIVQSGNDAAITLAEGIAGSEDAFTELLNKRAIALGMKNSNFQNAGGLHNEQQRSTARDLAVLARQIIHDYPDYYRIFSEPEFTWNKIRQLNRNPLVAQGIRRGRAQDRLPEGVRLRHRRLRAARRSAPHLGHRRTPVRVLIASSEERNGCSIGVFTASSRSLHSTTTKRSPRQRFMAAISVTCRSRQTDRSASLSNGKRRRH